ncbi:hypothetical protein BC937DRAFT_91693 [Endogone sp. FLAS-F59071]|nr:hypothetical protein BC937DRAFT_91693 [Endogone sp. FLAS-F59071]|eukprot:RUS16016.1 hypothetical protein BC937DRAFT_91693 [Endogone sp. FLAS-F59071]
MSFPSRSAKSHNQSPRGSPLGIHTSTLEWNAEPSNAVSSIDARISHTNDMLDQLNLNADSNQEEEKQKSKSWKFLPRLEWFIKDNQNSSDHEKKLRANHAKECEEIRRTTREECEKEYNSRLGKMKTEIRQMTKEEYEKKYNKHLAKHTKECAEIRKRAEANEQKLNNRVKEITKKYHDHDIHLSTEAKREREEEYRKMKTEYTKECGNIRRTVKEECEKKCNKRLEEMKTEHAKECAEIRKRAEVNEQEYDNRLKEMKNEYTKKRHDHDIHLLTEAKRKEEYKKMKTEHTKECDEIRQTTKEECEQEYNKRLEEMKTEHTKECAEIHKRVEINELEYNNHLEEYNNRLEETKAKHQRECAIWQKTEEEYNNRLEEMKTKYENEKSQGSLSESQDIRRGTEESKAELFVAKLHTELKASESEMYGRIVELEEQLRRERSLRPPDNCNVGLFEMDGANPDTFNQTWLKLHDSIRKSIENMLKQSTLQNDNVRDWCHNLISPSIPANSIPRATRLSKSVQKRIIEHCVTSVLATIWEIAVLGEPTVKHRPADGIFETDMTFSELESLQSSQSKKSEIAFLVTRTKSECAKLLLNKLPKPLYIEKVLKENANFDPFSCLPMRIRQQISEFYNRKFDAVIQVLCRFGDKNIIMQSKSSIISLVYTSIHVRLQMEAMQSGMMAVFAGTTSDCRAINFNHTLSVVQLQSDLHDAIASVNPPTKSEQYEADHTVLLTIFPGITNVKIDGDHITIDDQIENRCKVLSY